MMIPTNSNTLSSLDQLTRRAVRSFWVDGLWDLVIGGMFGLIGVWGMFYVQFLAFPQALWPFQLAMGRDVIWVGMLILIVGLTLYVWIAWNVVKYLKKILVSPYTGHVEHRFFMRVDPKLYIGYFILYAIGLGLLYGLLTWVKGGPSMMSVPFIISPAVMCWVTGKLYNLHRYQWIGVAGLLFSLTLELSLTTQADVMSGAKNFLDVLPQWSSPALPCWVWAGMFILSGLVGLNSVRKPGYETR